MIQTNIFDGQEESIKLKKYFETYMGNWSEIFSIDTLFRLKTTMKFVIDDAKNNHTIYPKRNETFRIYRDCPIDKVRVVIIGQDPYFNGNANGYAFGCKNEISPSLKQIIHSISKTCPKTEIKKDIGLSYLVEQGVFLLNTILTVREGQPLSHENIGWQNFTRDTIKLINKQDRNIVWLLWGGKAKYNRHLITNPKHSVYEDIHPVSATYEGEEWMSSTFQQTNEFFRNENQEEIKWN